MTQMVNMDDFRNEAGQIKWNEYEKAKLANGERCSACGCFIYPPRGRQSKCVNCETLSNQPGEVSHEKHVRCPKCQHAWSPGEQEQYALYEDGEHEATCPECDHEFQVRTWVSYSFDSPPLVQEPADSEEPDDE